MVKNSLSVVSIESTGLDPEHDHLIAVGNLYLTFEDDSIDSVYDFFYVKPNDTIKTMQDIADFNTVMNMSGKNQYVIDVNEDELESGYDHATIPSEIYDRLKNSAILVYNDAIYDMLASRFPSVNLCVITLQPLLRIFDESLVYTALFKVAEFCDINVNMDEFYDIRSRHKNEVLFELFRRIVERTFSKKFCAELYGDFVYNYGQGLMSDTEMF